MPLRDFDQVQERIHVRLEVRHVVQAVAAGLALLGVAFGAGAWWAGRQPVSPAAAPSIAQAPVAGAPPQAVAPSAVAPTDTDAPIVPVSVHLTPDAAEPAGLRAELKESAQAEAAVAAADDGAGNQQLATAPEEREVPRVEPAPVATPSPVEKPAPIAAPAPAPAPVPAVALAPVVRPPLELPARTLAPPGLTLIGTARMVPAASLAPPPPPVVGVRYTCCISATSWTERD